MSTSMDSASPTEDEPKQKLMVEVQILEVEKASLVIELKWVRVDPTQGFSKDIKKRIQKQ